VRGVDGAATAVRTSVSVMTLQEQTIMEPQRPTQLVVYATFVTETWLGRQREKAMFIGIPI
jgi:hypothetical protein